MRTLNHVRVATVLTSLALASGVFALPKAALAQTVTTDPAKLQQAKSLFIAGARAYTDRKYEVAIQAFEQANAIVPGAPVVFSIGQAYRKLFIGTNRPEYLREALKRYRDYIKMAPTGDRASEAEQAIQELSILESKFAPNEGLSGGLSPKTKTLLSISSPAEDATFTVDSGKPSSVGESLEVSAGKHRVHVSARGYFDEDRELVAAEAQITTLDIPLKEKPGALSIEGTKGARVLIDGRDFGETPLAKVDVISGSHQISVLKNGRKYYSEEFEFTRGKEKKIRVDLEISSQRKASYVAFGVGGVAIFTGAVLSLFALSAESSAVEIRDDANNGLLLNDPRQTGTGTAGDARLAEYNKYRDRRDAFNAASYVAYGAGGVALATGFALFLFDTPTASGERRRKDEKPVTPPLVAPPASDSKMMERGISFRPSISPAFAGGAIQGRF